MRANVLRYARGVQVFLVRHAAAVDETLDLRDPFRHLTALGRDQATSLGERLRWYDCSPTQIWASPLVRAVQTAELIASAMHCKTAVEVAAALAPEGDAHAVVAAVRALPASCGVLLVGHEPGLSAVGALLVGDPTFEGLAKAQAARIVDGVLRWRFAWDGEAPEPVTRK